MAEAVRLRSASMMPGCALPGPLHTTIFFFTPAPLCRTPAPSLPVIHQGRAASGLLAGLAGRALPLRVPQAAQAAGDATLHAVGGGGRQSAVDSVV